MIRVTVEENDAGQRLDRFLRKYLKRAPLSMIYRIIRKDLKVNGKRASKDQMLQCGDELVLYIPDEQFADLTKAMTSRIVRKQFSVAYEDENLLIADKPVGLLTHGDGREKKNTLANQVCGYLQQKGSYDPAREKTFRPAPVNRLDRNTSGLVVFGKNAEAMRALTRLFRERRGIRKYYLTIVCGRLEEEIIIDESIIKDETKNIVKVAPSDKKSLSRVRPLKTGIQYSLAEVELMTGRTHQIRVHMAHVGHPLAGDPKYGDPEANKRMKELGVTTQLLHANRLEFSHELKDDDILGALAAKTIKADPPRRFRVTEELLLTPATEERASNRNR